MKRRRPRGWILAFLLTGGVIVGIWIFPRGESKAARLRAELEARGESFTIEALGKGGDSTQDPTWPVLEEAEAHFYSLLRAQVDAPRGQQYEAAPAKPPQVGWQQPFLCSPHLMVVDWELARTLADRLRPQLARLHEVMRDPPSRPGGDYPVTTPDYAPMRVAVQGLHTLVMVELHRRQTERAYTNLVTLVRLCRLHQESWDFLGQLMRVAVTGVVTDALWHALQAPGWTEDQLRTLQAELARVDLIGPLPRAFELERIVVLQDVGDCRERGVSRLRAVSRQFGIAGAPSANWKQRLHHQHWRIFRADEIELEVIQDLQRLIERARLFAQGRPLDSLPGAGVPDRRSGFQRWFDKWACAGNPAPPLVCYTQAPDFSRALISVAHAEAQRRLALVALALERFQLATGRTPRTLAELVPEYLASVPLDPFDGRPMRYEHGLEGDFALSFRNAAGSVRIRYDDPLLWPIAEPPIPRSVPPPQPKTQRDEVLSLVSFARAPLIDVIATLARQAKLNLIFDPRVLEYEYPPVNIHLEQVTARGVLERLLRENRLRLERDRRTRIHRITL